MSFVRRCTVMQAVLLTLAACSSEQQITSPTASRPAASAVSTRSGNGGAAAVVAARPYLRVGTRVPPGQLITAPPEPYDAAKHGRALRDPHPEWNLVGRRGVVVPTTRPAGWRPPNNPLPPGYPTAGLGDRGLYLDHTVAQYYGMYQVNDVALNLNMAPPLGSATASYVYAPTVLPPNYSCVEMTTAHVRLVGNVTTRHYQGVADWCASLYGAGYGQFGYYAEMDLAFQNRYVRTYNGQPTLTLSIVSPVSGQSPRCWYAHLYDYLQGGWVQIYSSCGTPVGTPFGGLGWTMWESYYMLSDSNPNQCPTLPSVRAMDIQFADPSVSGYRPITNYPADISRLPASGDWPCWDIGAYTFSFPASGLTSNSWQANTP